MLIIHRGLLIRQQQVRISLCQWALGAPFHFNRNTRRLKITVYSGWCKTFKSLNVISRRRWRILFVWSHAWRVWGSGSSSSSEDLHYRLDWWQYWQHWFLLLNPFYEVEDPGQKPSRTLPRNAAVDAQHLNNVQKIHLADVREKHRKKSMIIARQDTTVALSICIRRSWRRFSKVAWFE